METGNVKELQSVLEGPKAERDAGKNHVCSLATCAIYDTSHNKVTVTSFSNYTA